MGLWDVVNPVATFLLAGMGIFVSLRVQRREIHVWWLATFTVLGLVGVGGSIWQSYKNSQAQADLRSQLKQIEQNTSRPPSIVVMPPPSTPARPAKLHVSLSRPMNFGPGLRMRVDVHVTNTGEKPATNFREAGVLRFVKLSRDQIGASAEKDVIDRVFAELKAKLDRRTIRSTSEISPGPSSTWWYSLEPGPELRESDLKLVSKGDEWVERDGQLILMAGLIRFSQLNSLEELATEFCAIMKWPGIAFTCGGHNHED